MSVTTDSGNKNSFGNKRLRQIYRQLIMKGFTTGEAGNLVAWLAGLPATTTPWKLNEVTHIVFISEISERIEP